MKVFILMFLKSDSYAFIDTDVSVILDVSGSLYLPLNYGQVTKSSIMSGNVPVDPQAVYLLINSHCYSFEKW